MSAFDTESLSVIAGSLSPRARVRQAAVSIWARHGYGATGIRDIAREVGMTSATLYHYTSSKEELLVRIMVDGQTALNEAIACEFALISRPCERLGILVGSLVAAHAMNPLSTRVIDTEIRSLAEDSPGRREVIQLRDQYERYWSQTLEAGQQVGEFKLGDTHVTRLALLTMCTGMSNWYRHNAGVDLVELAADFVDLALGAVRARVDGRALTACDLPAINMARVPRLASEPHPNVAGPTD